MKKVKINGALKSEEQNYNFEVQGFYGDEILKYEDNNVLVSIDMKNNSMIRSADSYDLFFKFEKNRKTTNVLKLKDLDQTIEMSLNTLDILQKDGYYYVRYELNEDEIFTFELFYEFL